MAALMRSVLRCSRLMSVKVPGNIQTRREVRALKRRPVRVIPPGEELNPHKSHTQGWEPLTQGDTWKYKAPLSQEKGKWKERSSLSQEKDKRKDTSPLTQDKGNWKEKSSLSQDKRKDKSPLTQDKGKWKEKSSLAQERTQQKGRSQEQHHQDMEGEMEVPQMSQPQELTYERARADDKRLCKVVSIAKSKSFRDRHGQVLLEGRRLLLDALNAGAVMQSLFFSTTDQIKTLPVDKLQQATLVKVKFGDVKMWSDVVAPQGVMGIFKKPDHVKMNYPEEQLKYTLPLSLICDNIRDPGNLGTILRSAAGAGCNKVLLTKGCVDAWEPKVIRAGMGAHFRLPIITGLDWDTINTYLSEDTKVFVADNSCEHHNVVVEEEEQEEVEIRSGKAIDYGWVSSDPRRVNYIEGEDYYSSGDEGDEELQDIPILPVQHYHQQWARGPSAIVIGGETRGLSIESLLLAGNSGGRRLYIPVVPGIESLNSAIAASILLFEARRQMQAKSLPPQHG